MRELKIRPATKQQWVTPRVDRIELTDEVLLLLRLTNLNTEMLRQLNGELR